MHIKTRITKTGAERFDVSVAKINKGFRKTKSFDSQAEAYEWGKRIEEGIKYGYIEIHPHHSKLKKSEWTVSMLIEEFKKAMYPMLSDNTKKNYTNMLNWLDSRCGTRLVVDLKAADFANLRDNLVARKANPSYIRKHFSLFGMLWDYAIKERDIIDINYVKNVRLPKILPYKNKAIDKDELKVLIDYALSDSPGLQRFFKTWLLVAIFTGLRKSELASITWQSIDEKNRTIYFQKTKNGHEHTVALPAIAFDALMRLPRVNRSKCGNFIFGNYTGTLKNFCKKHNLSHIHPHRLRHTTSTLISQADIATSENAKLLNQRTMEMSMRYTKQTVERKKELMQKVEEHALKSLGLQ